MILVGKPMKVFVGRNICVEFGTRLNLILFRCSQNSTRSTFFSESPDRNAHAAQESLLASLCN